ncbi:hypothetical protein [Winogradskyella vidalii]|uniref:hypothetical protein n=1 Tax=Winogradskyella vidalii TaxID=2615024 RepID=UPI0015CEF152|nr:hypothetical protein [Winogradskyella vidalii]
MKKSVYISNFLLILLAFSCGQNSSENELNGNWREIENEYSTWHFYPDSLVLKLPGEFDKKTVWKANKSEIELELCTKYWKSDSLGEPVGFPIDTISKVLINYELSRNKDSLFGTAKNFYGVHKFSMLKTKNYSEYLNRKFGIKFTLPKSDSTELIKVDPIYGLKIFISSANDQLIGKTELSNSLNNLENDIKSFKDQLETFFGPKDWRIQKFYLSVYADEKITDSIITTNLSVTTKSDFFINNDIPRPPNDTMAIRIYRMYANKENNKPEFRNAKRIKTIANTVYN